MNELKPCPFCGGKASLHGKKYRWVQCDDCRASTVRVEKFYWGQHIDEIPIQRWNRRATDGD